MLVCVKGIKKNFELTNYAHRTKQGVKKMSSSEITNYLSKCRERLLRTERKGIDFDCSNSLGDEEYF